MKQRTRESEEQGEINIHINRIGFNDGGSTTLYPMLSYSFLSCLARWHQPSPLMLQLKGLEMRVDKGTQQTEGA